MTELYWRHKNKCYTLYIMRKGGGPQAGPGEWGEGRTLIHIPVYRVLPKWCKEVSSYRLALPLERACSTACVIHVHQKRNHA